MTTATTSIVLGMYIKSHMAEKKNSAKVWRRIEEFEIVKIY